MISDTNDILKMLQSVDAMVGAVDATATHQVSPQRGRKKRVGSVSTAVSDEQDIKTCLYVLMKHDKELTASKLRMIFNISDAQAQNCLDTLCTDGVAEKKEMQHVSGGTYFLYVRRCSLEDLGDIYLPGDYNENVIAVWDELFSSQQKTVPSKVTSTKKIKLKVASVSDDDDEEVVHPTVDIGCVQSVDVVYMEMLPSNPNDITARCDVLVNGCIKLHRISVKLNSDGRLSVQPFTIPLKSGNGVFSPVTFDGISGSKMWDSIHDAVVKHYRTLSTKAAGKE